MTELLENREATLASLRRLLCQSSTEKTEQVLKQAGLEASEKKRKPAGKVKPPGHGRNGARAYQGAHRIQVQHASLAAGDRCPDCARGKVYPQSDPGVLVRIKGQAPIAATVYELEKLRCNLCGEVFTAEAPAGVGEEKYDATAASMIASLRYGSGFPWNRLEGLQENLGIPLPAATQCEIVSETAAEIRPAFDELIRQAAQGEVLHNDATSMRVVALNRAQARMEFATERTGVFTSGIVSTAPGRSIALFFTGEKHAGENLADVLQRRATELGAPIQMCDALSRNLPKLPPKLEIIIGHCLAHARRRFVEVTPNFPEECRFVLESLGVIYSNDAWAREQGMTPEERLLFHQCGRDRRRRALGRYSPGERQAARHLQRRARARPRPARGRAPHQRRAGAPRVAEERRLRGRRRLLHPPHRHQQPQRLAGRARAHRAALSRRAAGQRGARLCL